MALGEEGAANSGPMFFEGDLFVPGSLFVVVVFIFRTVLKLVADDKDRIRLFFLVEESPWWAAYVRMLARVSGGFDRFFGRKYFGWRAFERCLVLSLVYPVVALVVMLTLAAPAKYQSSLFGFLIALALGVSIWVLFFWIARVLIRWTKRARLSRGWTQRRQMVMEFAGSFAIAGVGTVLVPGIIWSILAVVDSQFSLVSGEVLLLAAALIASLTLGPVVSAVSMAGTRSGIGTAAFLGAVMAAAGIAAVSLSVVSSEDALIILLCFSAMIFLYIYAVNAFMDWLSWGVSRWLIKRIQLDAERGLWGAIVLHIALDLALALLFLGSLLMIFGASMTLFDPAGASLRGVTVIADAETDPLGGGFWMAAMMVTTLVPTVLHLSVAVFALAAVPVPFTRNLLMRLEDRNPATSEMWVSAAYLTAWVALALSGASFALYFILSVTSYHGHTIWMGIFDFSEMVIFRIARF